MKRTTLLLAFVIVASMAAVSFAQEMGFWFDARDNVTSAGTGVGGQLIAPGAPAAPYTNGQEPAAASGNSTNRFGETAINAGARGAGGVLRLHPVQNSGIHAIANPAGAGSAWPNYPRRNQDGTFTAADGNSATGSLYLYTDVNNDATGGLGDVISSVGLNINLGNNPFGAVVRDPIGSIAMTMFDGTAVASQNGGLPADPWDGVVSGTSDGAVPPNIPGNKAVQVPVVAGPPPSYAATEGIQPNATGPYCLGRLDVTAGTRNCLGLTNNTHVDGATYTVKLSVGNLLITRVFSSGGDAQEDVAMGYDPFVMDGAYGTLDASVPGNVENNTSANWDAAIQVRMHCDFNGSGTVTTTDIAGFNSAKAASTAGTAKVSQIYLGDLNNSRSVTTTDIAGFNAVKNSSAACP